MKASLFVVLMLLLSACATAYTPPPPPPDHPASAAAEASPRAASPDLLVSALDVDVKRVRPPAPDDSGTPMQAGAHAHGDAPMHGDETATPGDESATPGDGTPALPPAAETHLRHLLGAYLVIGRDLAADTHTGAVEDARAIGAAAEALANVEMPGRPHFWHERAGALQTIAEQAGALATAADLHAARVAYGRLSDALGALLPATGAPAGYEPLLYRFVCGMFQDAPGGGVWFQQGAEPRNPYFGSRMLTCFREKTLVPAAGGEGMQHGDEPRPQQMEPGQMESGQMEHKPTGSSGHDHGGHR